MGGAPGRPARRAGDVGDPLATPEKEHRLRDASAAARRGWNHAPPHNSLGRTGRPGRTQTVHRPEESHPEVLAQIRHFGVLIESDKNSAIPKSDILRVRRREAAADTAFANVLREA